MEFSVSKSDLVRELGLTQGVVEKKTTIPILSNILVETDQDQVWLTATDLELGIRCACPARIKKEGAGTIPARRLLDYVRLLPDADVQVKLAENQWASFICGRSRTRIAGMSRESFPELPQMPETLASIPLAVLSQMIGSTIFAISAEESRFTLNGALLILKDTGLVMVATDGHRLALVEKQVELPGLSGAYRALLPKKAMSEIQKLASEDGNKRIEFSGNENHLFFRIDKRLLLSRKLTGNFPDYERVLPKEHPHMLLIQREELKAAIERVAQFADERSRAIRLQVLKNGELKVHSSISETGESEETIPVDYKGSDTEIGFNAQYLLDFLRSVDQSEVEFHFKDANSAGELRPHSGPAGTAYRYVVMPMRI